MDACIFILLIITAGIVAGILQLTTKNSASYKLGAGIGRKTRKLYDWIVDEEKK